MRWLFGVLAVWFAFRAVALWLGEPLPPRGTVGLVYAFTAATAAYIATSEEPK